MVKVLLAEAVLLISNINAVELVFGAGGASVVDEDVNVGVAVTVIVGPELGVAVTVTVTGPLSVPVPFGPVPFTPGVAMGTTGSPAIGTIDNPSNPAGACVAIAAEAGLV